MLIVEARFYDDIQDALLEGAVAELNAAGVTHDLITVPGALEIPAAIAIALDAAEDNGKPYDAAIALGCVIRGETIHFDIVASESSRALMDLAVARRFPLGNGILTVNTDAQAWARARASELTRAATPRGRRWRCCGSSAGWQRPDNGRQLKPAKSPDKKANRRGAARLAAVQALYQMDIAGAGINDIFAEFESHWLGSEVEGEKYLPAEAAFFRDVVAASCAIRRRLDPMIDAALQKGWPLQRIDAVLRAVLRAGAYELEHRNDVPGRGSCPNMSTSRTPSSIATRPAWSMPCSTRSRASCAPTSSRAWRERREPACGEDRLIARYFRPLATDPGAFGLTTTPQRSCRRRLRYRGDDGRDRRGRAFFSRRSARHRRAQGAAGESFRSRRERRDAGRLRADAGAAQRRRGLAEAVRARRLARMRAHSLVRCSAATPCQRRDR